MKWIFLYACVTFACHREPPAIAGDGVYRPTRAACERAAVAHARRHRINTKAREIVCVEREPEE